MWTDDAAFTIEGPIPRSSYPITLWRWTQARIQAPNLSLPTFGHCNGRSRLAPLSLHVRG